jgi:hypothetical protein
MAEPMEDMIAPRKYTGPNSKGKKKKLMVVCAIDLICPAHSKTNESSRNENENE